MFGPTCTGIIFFNATKMMRMKVEDIKSPLHFAKSVQMTLNTYQYCYVQTGDLINGDCTSTKVILYIAMFILGVEKEPSLDVMAGMSSSANVWVIPLVLLYKVRMK